jgi:hypothetical protein
LESSTQASTKMPIRYFLPYNYYRIPPSRTMKGFAEATG